MRLAKCKAMRSIFGRLLTVFRYTRQRWTSPKRSIWKSAEPEKRQPGTPNHQRVNHHHTGRHHARRYLTSSGTSLPKGEGANLSAVEFAAAVLAKQVRPSRLISLSESAIFGLDIGT